MAAIADISAKLKQIQAQNEDLIPEDPRAVEQV
jgi:hypothetical protein